MPRILTLPEDTDWTYCDSCEKFLLCYKCGDLWLCEKCKDEDHTTQED